jgi:hypothetical protein
MAEESLKLSGAAGRRSWDDVPIPRCQVSPEGLHSSPIAFYACDLSFFSAKKFEAPIRTFMTPTSHSKRIALLLGCLQGLQARKLEFVPRIP